MSTMQETTVLNKIRMRGFWKVVIRPTTFQERRIARLPDLFPIVRKNSVQLRGWDYPHIDSSQKPRTGSDWVGQEYDRKDKIEVWRIYLSGLFVHFFPIAGDWRDQSSVWPAEPGWAPGREFYYLHTIYSLVEIFEFAARLALSHAGGNPMRIEIDMEGLAGRRLKTTDGEIALFGEYQTEAPEWKHRWEGSQTELIAERHKLAALAARDLFNLFGLNVDLEILSRLRQRMAR
jgi:hypothetical protein